MILPYHRQIQIAGEGADPGPAAPTAAGALLFGAADQAGTRSRLAIDAQRPQAWEESFQRPFELLGADTNPRIGLQSAAGMIGEDCIPAAFEAAVVAAQPILLKMQNQARIAARTARDPAAGVTQHHRREAAAIEEQQALLTACGPLEDGTAEIGSKMVPYQTFEEKNSGNVFYMYSFSKTSNEGKRADFTIIVSKTD